VGLTYTPDEVDPDFISNEEDKKFTQPVKFNAVFRSGINESDVIGAGQFPFYIFSCFLFQFFKRAHPLSFCCFS